MFREITRIPTTENKFEFTRLEAVREVRDLKEKLLDIYREQNMSTYYAVHNALEEFLDLMAYVDVINTDPDKYVLSLTYRNNEGNIRYLFNDTDMYGGAVGIVIHKCSAQKYEEIAWNNQVVLEGASETLKQTPKHFLKLFHKEDNPNLLFVWSNQDLNPETVYKIKMLQNRLNEQNLTSFNPITKEIYEAFVEGNIQKINAAFKKFFDSPAIAERQYKDFVKTLSFQSERNKESIQQKIRNNYDSIQSYENSIARLASEINDLNMRLLALQNKDDTAEEIDMLFKYLNKHPYIKSFTVNVKNGSLCLDFRSPLIYFTDYAIEKIKKNYSDPYDQIIFDIFLEKRFQLVTECSIIFNVCDFSISPASRHNRYNDIMGHPHIDEYGCLGNHREAIYESAETKDYIGAIEQISQATMNINFYDACIVGYVIRYFGNPTNRKEKKTWLDSKTGEYITLEEVIERRKEANEEA